MTNEKRKIEITFTEKKKGVNLEMIASAVAKQILKGGKTDGQKNRKVL
jgi:hypothetical protein